MRTKQDRFTKQAQLWILVWTAGLWLGIFILLLRWFRGLSVRNQERLPRKGPTLIVANHPAIWETVILPGLFFLRYLFNPSLVPWSTPDKNNFTSKWFLKWARPVSIPMARDNGRELVSGVEKIVETLQQVQQGQTVIFFPEGGRTWRKRPDETYLYSPQKRQRMRPLKPAALKRIVLGVPGVTIVPVWVDRPDDNRMNVNGLPDWWRRMEVLVGEPILPEHRVGTEELTHQLEQALLALADQVSKQ